MAAFGLSWGTATALGPMAAGVILDNYNPNWLWYAAGITFLVTVAGFLGLNRLMPHHKEQQPAGQVALAEIHPVE